MPARIARGFGTTNSLTATSMGSYRFGTASATGLPARSSLHASSPKGPGPACSILRSQFRDGQTGLWELWARKTQLVCSRIEGGLHRRLQGVVVLAKGLLPGNEARFGLGRRVLDVEDRVLVAGVKEVAVAGIVVVAAQEDPSRTGEEDVVEHLIAAALAPATLHNAVHLEIVHRHGESLDVSEEVVGRNGVVGTVGTHGRAVLPVGAP